MVYWSKKTVLPNWSLWTCTQSTTVNEFQLNYELISALLNLLSYFLPAENQPTLKPDFAEVALIELFTGLNVLVVQLLVLRSS